MQSGIMACRGLMLAGLVLATSSQSRAQSTPLEAARMFSAAFNAGDDAKAAALMSPSGLVVVDEIAPYLWTGKSAFATWIADYDKDAKTKVLTDPVVTMGSPLVNTTAGDMAYFVCPMTYTYKIKGVPMREPARMAMVLRKEGSVWRFVSYTWTGTEPKPASQTKHSTGSPAGTEAGSPGR